LTAEGIEQAQRLGERLEADEISLGVASSLARTQETLALAVAGRSVSQLVVPELNEIDFGAFADGPLRTYRAWAAAHPPYEAAPGGGDAGRGGGAGSGAAAEHAGSVRSSARRGSRGGRRMRTVQG